MDAFSTNRWCPLYRDSTLPAFSHTNTHLNNDKSKLVSKYIYIEFYFSLCLHAWQACTFFKSYMHSSFFYAFCHVLLHLLCMAGVTVKQVIIKQKQKNINKIDTIKIVQEKLDSSIQIRASGLSKDSTKRIIQTLCNA